LELPNTAIDAAPFTTVSVNLQKGGAGECGSQCTTRAECQSWSYSPAGSHCSLFSTPLDRQHSSLKHRPGATTGRRGDLGQAGSWNWTACPELFRKNGYHLRDVSVATEIPGLAENYLRF
jgi:hypothetical protein